MERFWVGQAETREVLMKYEHGQTLPEFTGIEAYYVFRFANKTRAAITAINVVPDASSPEHVKASFIITRDFFTDARKGPCETQIVLLDDHDFSPVVAYPIQKAEVVGMIMSPTELTA